KVRGTANPSLSLTYTGFVSGEDARALTTPPSGSTTALDSSPAGSYPITLTGGSATNYTLTLQNGTLTVNMATATVTLGSLRPTYNGTAQRVTTTTVPNGLAVNVTYNGSSTPPVNTGTYTVVATVSDANY